MKLILLGAPGAGKGTQAELISKRYNIPQISTGNIIREAMKSGSRMGEQVRSYMEKGELVPDDVVIDIVKDRVKEKDCENGYILDGFPRTIPQAEALEERLNVEIDAVLEIDVKDSEIIERLSGRRVCENCGSPYHTVYKKPKVDGVCDICSGTLIQRKDDAVETVEERLRVYHRQTEPLIAYYKESGKLITVQGQDSIEKTSELVLKALEDLK